MLIPFYLILPFIISSPFLSFISYLSSSFSASFILSTKPFATSAWLFTWLWTLIIPFWLFSHIYLSALYLFFESTISATLPFVLYRAPSDSLGIRKCRLYKTNLRAKDQSFTSTKYAKPADPFHPSIFSHQILYTHNTTQTFWIFSLPYESQKIKRNHSDVSLPYQIGSYKIDHSLHLKRCTHLSIQFD